jgi:hypothetical protein
MNCRAGQAKKLGRRRLLEQVLSPRKKMTTQNGISFRLVMLGMMALSFPDAAFARAVQFSADLIDTKAAGSPDVPRGKIFVANSDVRIEAPNDADGFFIIQRDRSAAYLVRPAHHLYMDAAQSSLLTQILVPVDPNDPCPQWQAMATIAGAAANGAQWRCERFGTEKIDGRDTVLYRAISPQNQSNESWIDSGLGFPIRLMMADGTRIDLANIQQGPQAASLFEVPADYQKFDPRQLIDRIKQSDVWVASPQSEIGR